VNTRITAIVLAAVLLSTSVASATSVWVGPTAGLGFPLGDFGDAAKTGFFGGLESDHWSNDRFGYGGDLLFNHNAVKDVPTILGGGNRSGSITPISISAHAKYAFPSSGRYAPFLRGGIGLYHVSTKVDAAGSSPGIDDSATKFGIHFGGGASMKNMGSAKLGLEAAYHIVFTDNSSTSFLNLGLLLQFQIAAGK